MPTFEEIINKEISCREEIEFEEHHSHRSILSEKTLMEYTQKETELKELLAEADICDIHKAIDEANDRIDFFIKKISAVPLVANDNPKFHNHLKLSVDALISDAVTETSQLKALLYPSDKLKSLNTFANVLETTYRLLNNQISPADYHQAASQMKGYPSPTEKKLGVLMMGICAAVAAILLVSGTASVIGLVATCTVGLLGFGLFSEGNGEGIGKTMCDLEKQIMRTN